MSLMDFFLPEVSQAQSLRNISASLSARNRSRARSGGDSAATRDLERDLGFVALVLFSAVGKLIERGLLTREELLDTVRELDGLDGVEDGKLDPDAIRAALGLARKPDEKAPPKVKVRRTRRRRS